MIEIKNVSFSYKGFEEEDNEEVLKNIDLTINDNEHTCILGHNGSGKSTLAKLLVGLDFCDKGTILIDNIEINEENVYQIREKIGIVFQNPDNQFIGATVQDDIAFGLENKCVPSEDMQGIIEEYAGKVGMQEFLDKEPTRLSGGQKQRVAIAGILATNPKIMIFDEATSMLDPIGIMEVNNSIEELRKENKTIISITHDVDYALKTDRLIVLDEGAVLFDGKPRDVFKHQDRLVEIGLDIPFALKISNALQNEGLTIKNCLSMKELEEELCQ
ncbi:MAG: energy-coupling factor transporter ATPase [Erysipelotrichales bacterium]